MGVVEFVVVAVAKAPGMLLTLSTSHHFIRWKGKEHYSIEFLHFQGNTSIWEGDEGASSVT